MADHPLDAYAALLRGDLTEQEAADALKVTLREVRFRLSRWGPRLPLLLTTLDGLRQGTVTRPQAAQALGVDVDSVNDLMQTWKVTRKRQPPKMQVAHAAAQVKWKVRRAAAVKVIAGSQGLDDAADEVGVHLEQMRWWVHKLLKQHSSLSWMDLKRLPKADRALLAAAILQVEGLGQGLGAGT